MAETADDGGKDQREPDSAPKRRSQQAPDGEVAPTREALKASPEKPISTEKGDVPEALRNRYFTEATVAAVVFYAEYNAPKPAFRDAGGRLSTSETNPNTIRDMIDVAEHRGWRALQVRGTEDFKREVWLEAQSRGVEVRGFRPNQRDFQELERRTTSKEKGSISPSKAREPTSDRAHSDPPTRSGRVDYESGVRGRLIEVGRAPFRGRENASPAPFVRIQPEKGKAVQIWGVALPAAIARAGAKVGDEITLRREGVDRLADRGGQEHQRNRWVVEAERLRNSTPAEAARDPQLKAAQAALGVVSSVARQRLDPAAADRVVKQARIKAADRMEDGARFQELKVRGPRPPDRAYTSSERVGEGPERVRRR